ncbi:SDR family NAD(P)-dependent oxidoreductase [Streptomyces sp. AD2-2]|nr:SDR family NAD(P)-dependent oxidoreductase [Streptomyces sp. AD2-2]
MRPRPSKTRSRPRGRASSTSTSRGPSSASRRRPPLCAARRGALVNVASTMALGGTAHYAPYVASKWAIRGLTQTVALELGRDHIRVNTIHPGVISTPSSTSRRPARSRRSPTSTHPSRSPSPGSGSRPTSAVFSCSSRQRTRRSSRGRSTEYVIDGGLLLGPALQATTV